MKRKWTISILENEPGDGADHEFKCAQNGVKLNIALYDAINSIRSRLKYGSDETSESEIKFLEDLRSELRAAYIEEVR